jgi:hypothetical protein
MAAFGRALLFGFLVWLIPFVTAFAIFPLRQSARPLFESIMPVTVTLVVVAFGLMYFKGVTRRFTWEGLSLGLLWMAESVAIDAPLMLLGGPMQMSGGEYLADIGVTYLLMPVVTVGLGLAKAASPRPQVKVNDASREPE